MHSKNRTSQETSQGVAAVAWPPSQAAVPASQLLLSAWCLAHTQPQNPQPWEPPASGKGFAAATTGFKTPHS